MPIIETIGLLLLGFATGILGGYLGIGGALLITPVFLAMLKGEGVSDALRFKLAFGTALLSITGTGISAALSYAKMRRVHWPAVRATGIAAIVFSFVGSYLAARSPSFYLQYLFVVFALANVVMMLSPLKAHGDGDCSSSILRFTLIGVIAGLVSAYVGVAGGVIMVPLYLFWCRLPFEKAPGSSSAVGVMTSIVGTIGYIINGWHVPDLPTSAIGYVMPTYALPVLVGTLLGGPLGSKLNKRFGGSVFRKVFAFFLLAIALKILFAP
ncbi:sulfite exporter TauE/SafE family protein [bacterium]|nr:sulfite exporter TauE/SafE family protein [bacterium]